MSSLELRFLGQPEVRKDSRLLKFPTRKALALLVYLVVAGGWHSREKLIALLWPESAPTQGQASLRNALIRLRRTLGESQTYLLIEGDLLSFVMPPPLSQGGLRGGSLDLLAVPTAASSDLASLQEAVERYRGDFLEGFTLPDAPAFEEWASLQREFWHRQMSQVLARLAHLQAEAGQRHPALATVRRWTAHDPLDEAAHRRLMALYSMAGDRAAALQAYESCRALLAAELATEPSPETKTLAEQIRNSGLPDSSSGVAKLNPKSFELPLVGRAIKHLQLVSAFHTVRQSQPRAVAISGEAGIGKTRLATEFLAWAVANGADILQGRAFETGGRLPYQPLVELLRRRVERENAPEDWLSDEWLAELSRLLPELRERYPDLPPPSPDETLARTRLPEAVARLGQTLASPRRPVIIFIDDLQWADTASLDMLSYCARSWVSGSAPILLLFTVRQEDLAASPLLPGSTHPAAWLANLARELPLQYLKLEALTPDDVRQLAHFLVGEGEAPLPVQQFGHWLFAETSGQPFFIDETLKELVERGLLSLRLDPEGGYRLDVTGIEAWGSRPLSDLFIPGGVRHRLLARLSRLSPGASALLAAAAVIARPCDYPYLCQVAGLADLAGLDSLDELLRLRLMVESDDPNRPYTLSHDQIRQLVYTEASAARRQLLHRRAFEALAAISPPPSSLLPPSEGRVRGVQGVEAELAHHALAAGLNEAACRYSLAAGERALSLFAVQEAINAYEQARRLLPEVQAALPQTPLYLGLGRAYELAGRLNEAAAIYLEGGQQLQALGQIEPTCLLLNRLATVAIHAFQFEKAEEYLQQTLDLAERYGYQLGLAEAEWGLAQLYHHQFNFAASLVHSERTLVLARALDNKPMVAASLNALAYAEMLLGRLEAGEARMEEALALYTKLGNKALEADCLTAIAAAQIWQGKAQQGLESAQAAEAICARIANSWGHIYSRVWLSVALLDGGNYEAALTTARAGHEQARVSQLPAMSLFIKLILGKVYQALGQAEMAYQVHLEAMTLNEQLKSEFHQPWILAELGADCVLRGDWAEAAAYARKALACRTYTTLPLVIPACWPEIAALLSAGEKELAREELERWREWLGYIPRFRPGYLHALALLVEAEGDLAQALDHLNVAYTLAAQMGLPEEQREILISLGRVHRARGEAEKAQHTFEAAGKIIGVLAAGIEDEALRASFLTTRRAPNLTSFAP